MLISIDKTTFNNIKNWCENIPGLKYQLDDITKDFEVQLKQSQQVLFTFNKRLVETGISWYLLIDNKFREFNFEVFIDNKDDLETYFNYIKLILENPEQGYKTYWVDREKKLILKEFE